MTHQLPSFLRQVTMSTKVHATLSKHLSNWLKAQAYIQSRNHSAVVISQMMVIELQAERPREGMIDKLISRYNTAIKNERLNEMAKYMNRPNVVPIKRHEKAG